MENKNTKSLIKDKRSKDKKTTKSNAKKNKNKNFYAKNFINNWFQMSNVKIASVSGVIFVKSINEE